VPISTICPRCNAKMKAPDNAIGRKAKCPKCGAPFVVNGQRQQEDGSLCNRPPANTSAAETFPQDSDQQADLDVLEVIEEEDIVLAEPADDAPRRSRSRRDDFDADAPRRASRHSRRRHREDDDDEDDDDEPRRRARKRCPECDAIVSRQADVCPRCGHPLKRGFLGAAGTERALNITCLVVVLVLIVPACLWFILMSGR